MDVLELKVWLNDGTERTCTADFVNRQVARLVELRKDESYLFQDWAFQVQTLAEWLNSTQPDVSFNPAADFATEFAFSSPPGPIADRHPPRFFMWNPKLAKRIPSFVFGKSRA